MQWFRSLRGNAHERTVGHRLVQLPARLIITIASVPCLAFAAPREVIPGEYIIEPSPAVVGIESVNPAVTDASLNDAGLFVKEPLAGGRMRVVSPQFQSLQLDASSSAYDPEDRFCKQLLRSGLAKSCEQNQKISLQSTTPNDPRLPELWGLGVVAGIDAPRGWDYSTGSSGVVVAVIDTGIDYNHPDLSPNVWSNPGEIPGNGIDDDGDGYVDDIHGINALANTGDPMDDNSHGTHVSGTIGARGNDNHGVVGINWNVKLMGLKFLGAGGSGSISGAIKAIDYMVMMKQRGVNIRVANNSWGGPGFSQALSDAIQRASDAGIVFVAAAGNESNDNDANPQYPASYEPPNVVSVAALDNQRNLASFSNYGLSTVDIAAPGVDILSTAPNNSYASYSGTSMATPHVTGALALLFAANPALTMSEGIQRLYDTGIALTSLNGLTRTGRMLNLGRLMANDSVPLPPPPTPAPPCPYSISSNSASVDHRADNGIVLLNHVDEFGFQSVTLPFEFAFDGVPVSNVVVSPNGVLYFGTTPGSMDWQNSKNAPSKSLAALHTDLVSTVRMSATSDSLTLYWSGNLYTSPSAGNAEIRVTISKDGTIRQWLNFSSASILHIIRDAETVGITGRSAQSISTYSYNDSKVGNGTSLIYTPSCGSGQPSNGEPKVAQVRMWGVDSTGRLQSHLTPGQRVRVRVRGASDSGTGLVQAAVMLDGQLCGEAPQFQVSQSAEVVLQGRLAKVLSNYGVKQLSISAQNVSAARAILTPASLRPRRASKPVLTSERFGELCSSIARSIRSRAH